MLLSLINLHGYVDESGTTPNFSKCHYSSFHGRLSNIVAKDNN